MFENLSVREVESELVGMAGHLAAGTCRFLQLLAEFDDRDGWAGPGLRSCAHWLNWRVGMDLRTGREQLRVAHALRALPAATAAFAAGRVSYSKVRALTRIASVENEATLLNVALHGTAAQLDGLVAAARAGADLRGPATRRGLHCSRDTEGSLLVKLRMPAEQGELFLVAVQARLEQTAAQQATGQPGSAEPSQPAPAEPPAAGGFAEPPDRAASPAEPSAVAEVHRRGQAAREELRTRAAEHAPGPVLEPLAARRLDALLDLLTGDLAEPATLVVHLRVDELDAPATELTDPGLRAVPEPAGRPDSTPGQRPRHRR